MILLAFRHWLRAAKLCDLSWDQVEFVSTEIVPPSWRAVERANLQLEFIAQPSPHGIKLKSGGADRPVASPTRTRLVWKRRVGERKNT